MDILTKLEQQKLSSIGLDTLYSVITYFPYTYISLLPFVYPFTSGQRYIVNGTILSVNPVFKGKKRYLKINLDITSKQLMCYMFSFSPYLLKALKQGQKIQCILVEKGGFWNIEKFAELKDVIDSHFVLGKAKIDSYHLPKYPKNGEVTHQLLTKIHNKLPRNLYTIELSGLVPTNNLIPTKIDLSQIHHPKSIQQTKETKLQYTAFKSFLRMSLILKSEEKREKGFGKQSNIDETYLKTISTVLPYSLSMSQKNAIWEILQDVKS